MTGRITPPAVPSERPNRTALTSPADSAALRIRCSADGFARARAFTHDTLRCWSLDHCSDDAALVITELAANAVEHAVPRAPVREAEVWLALLLAPANLVLSVSDPCDNPPEYMPTDGSALREHGRGLCIVDVLAEEWGWTPDPPVGKTVWAKLSTCPPP
jgi:hypothetical protein